MHFVIGLIVTICVLFAAKCLSWWRVRDHHDRHLLLNLLLTNPDSYGIELQKRSGGKLGMGIYPKLRLLEDEGLVSTRRELRSSNVPGPRPRIRYSLTSKGRTEAQRLRETYKLAA